MKVACVSLAALAWLASASGMFYAGMELPQSQVLVSQIISGNFEKSKQVIHFNTCREHNIIVDLIEVENTEGSNIIGTLLYGGFEDFYVGVELTASGQAKYRVTVWGHWRGPPETIDTDKVLLQFDRWWPCNHAVKLY